jgi:hypothetical protein
LAVGTDIPGTGDIVIAVVVRKAATGVIRVEGEHALVVRALAPNTGCTAVAILVYRAVAALLPSVFHLTIAV